MDQPMSAASNLRRADSVGKGDGVMLLPERTSNRSGRSAPRGLTLFRRRIALGLAILALPILFRPQGLSLPASEPTATIIHVAVDGNDAWAGRLERPDLDLGDGPVASIGRAGQAR